MSKTEWTEGQIKEAKHAVQSYMQSCETRWSDMIFELEMKLGLTEEQAEKLASEVQ